MDWKVRHVYATRSFKFKSRRGYVRDERLVLSNPTHHSWLLWRIATESKFQSGITKLNKLIHASYY
ncbi:hypothetical protein MARINOS108_11863 [Marinoscillum sp. 108]|nr:hypothetical protein MARINOS108_11863 [Marinoscillum sp. 108]